MESRTDRTRRALVRFALVAAASVAAASLWAQGAAEPGLLLDAHGWRDEVATAATGPWPANGWYRLAPREREVDVRPVRPTDRVADPSGDELYVRLPGATLASGPRPAVVYPEVLQLPRMGVDHALALGDTRFTLRTDYVDQGIAYTIAYGGESYRYVLGRPGADHTVVRAVADVDGDRRPDFVVDVDDTVYLLLSTQARPGTNGPTAHFVEQGC